MKKVAEKVGRSPSQLDYKKHGKASNALLYQRFDGGWKEAKKQAGLDVDTRGSYSLSEAEIDEIQGFLKDKNGRYSSKELRREMKEELDARVVRNKMEEIWEKVDERDNGLKISVSGGAWNGSKVFIRNEEVDPYEEYREKLPEGTEPVFEECISTGRSPQGVLGALLYLEGEEDFTQSEAASRAGCAALSIRNVRDFIVENELLEERGVSVE